MSKTPHRLVVVGHGAAGLSAALTAVEVARRHDLPVEVTLVEKAPEESAGGNTLWSPSYIRLAAPDRVAPDFEEDMLRASNGRADRLYFGALANNATATVGWLKTHGVEFCSPGYYLSAGPLRIQPIGGGRAIVDALSRAAKRHGVAVQYRCSAQRLVVAPNGQVSGLVVASGDTTETMRADAVILATGGFQANRDMMHTHFGLGGQNIRLLAPRAHHNTGDGIRMAMEHGARISGDWNGMHAEPVDPRAENSAPVVLVIRTALSLIRTGEGFSTRAPGWCMRLGSGWREKFISK